MSDAPDGGAVAAPQPDHTPDEAAPPVAAIVEPAPPAPEPVAAAPWAAPAPASAPEPDYATALGHLFAGFEALLGFVDHAASSVPGFGGMFYLANNMRVALDAARAAMTPGPK